MRQPLQSRGLPAGQAPRRIIGDAQGAEPVFFSAYQWNRGVKTKVRGRRHQGVVEKTLVGERVLNDETVRTDDGMRAERKIPRQLGNLQADFGLDPLAVGIDKGDQRNRRAAEERGEPGESVKYR